MKFCYHPELTILWEEDAQVALAFQVSTGKTEGVAVYICE